MKARERATSMPVRHPRHHLDAAARRERGHDQVQVQRAGRGHRRLAQIEDVFVAAMDAPRPA
jgi:hypothetical protein